MMTSFGRIALLLVFVCSTALAVPAQPITKTLREYIESHGVDPQGCSSPYLDVQTSSLATLNDAEVYVTAYLARDEKLPCTHAQVELFDKVRGTWSRAELNNPRNTCQGGTIFRIQRTQNAYYLYVHINPTAVETIILSPELEYCSSVWGRFLGEYSDGSLVYFESQPHFLSIRAARILIYDPATEVERLVYPMKPYRAMRLEHMAKVQAIYDSLGRDWFLKHVHHGDSDLFTERVVEFVLNDATDSLALVSEFYETDDLTERYLTTQPLDPEQHAELPKVVYVYRNVRDPEKIDFREALPDDLAQRYGTRKLEEYLEPHMLQTLFDDLP